MIKKFTLDYHNKQLEIDWLDIKKQANQLSYEYLRVNSPQVAKDIVSHKKQVNLVKIEPVGKHGFRFHFDDEHSAIYSGNYLQELVDNYQQRWSTYLAKLQASGKKREAMIDIKQL